MPARARFPAAIYARLRLRDPLPLHAGDRVILRDPGAAGLAIYGATVLDPFPPPLARRGAGAAAVRELGGWPDVPRAADLLRRHKLLRAPQLAAAGVAGLPEPVARDWLADPEHWAWLRAELPKVVAAFCARDPLAPGMPAEAARAALSLPTRDLVPALAGGDVLLDGAYLRIFTKHAAGSRDDSARHPPRHRRAAAGTGGRPARPPPRPARPAAAPASPASPPRGRPASTADRRGSPGGTRRPCRRTLRRPRHRTAARTRPGRQGARRRRPRRAAAARRRPGRPRPRRRQGGGPRAGRLRPAVHHLQARQALNTSRRVAIPLLEYLDRARVTERLPGDLRRIRNDVYAVSHSVFGCDRGRSWCQHGSRLAGRPRVVGAAGPGPPSSSPPRWPRPPRVQFVSSSALQPPSPPPARPPQRPRPQLARLRQRPRRNRQADHAATALVTRPSPTRRWPERGVKGSCVRAGQEFRLTNSTQNASRSPVAGHDHAVQRDNSWSRQAARSAEAVKRLRPGPEQQQARRRPWSTTSGSGSSRTTRR